MNPLVRNALVNTEVAVVPIRKEKALLSKNVNTVTQLASQVSYRRIYCQLYCSVFTNHCVCNGLTNIVCMENK